MLTTSTAILTPAHTTSPARTNPVARDGVQDSAAQPAAVEGFGERVALRMRELGKVGFGRYIGSTIAIGEPNLQGQTASVTASVLSAFHQEWFSKRYGKFLTDAVRAEAKAMGAPRIKLEWTVDASLFPTDGTATRRTEDPTPAPTTREHRPTRRTHGSVNTNGATQFGGRFSMDDFVVGASNRLAVDASQRLVEGDAPAGMTALFLHGPCGVGKTHLLSALAQMYAHARPEAKVRYVTGEGFTNEYVSAVQSKSLEAFRRKYRGVELLCIDDVHFLAGKVGTQNELLHTFDALDLDGARLVLASDEHPKRIDRFNARLVSRCVSGMVVRIDAPDRAMREAVAARLAQRRGLRLTDSAAAVVAEACYESIREIEGALMRVEAYTRVVRQGDGERLTAADVRAALGDTIGRLPAKPLRVSQIVDTVCALMGVEVSEVMGSGRHRLVVLARSAAAALCRELTTQSFPEIARAMNRKNHSTIVTSCQRIAAQSERGEAHDAGALGIMPIPSLLSLLRDEVRRRA